MVRFREPVESVAMPAFELSPLAPRRTPEEEARDRDLGFGSVVSRARVPRLLNRDGSFNVSRAGLGLLERLAPYHQLVSMSWTGFFAVLAAIYVAINVLFAAAYIVCGAGALVVTGADILGGRFSRAFFFSVETFATIGYGQIAPVTVSANLVVTAEALVGLIYQALATGLLFARFARPTASVVFSRGAVIAPYAGGTALMFRVVNRRRQEIIELEAQVLFSAMEPDGRGGTARRYTILPLERNKVTFFPLSWTVVHPIDAGSPLAGKTAEELERVQAEILVLFSGTDETFEQTVHARTSYRADEIAWNSRFVSMFLQPDARDRVAVDIRRLHDVERV